MPNQTLQKGFEDLVNFHKLNIDTVYQLLKKLNLNTSLLDRKPNEVSGGELQRLSIIRILLLKPVFIFADEMTSRLDPISQKEVLFLVKNIVEEEGLSLLLVTHDYEIAQKISHTMIFLEV